MLNEKGMVPKDKGWGCQTLVMGEKPMFCHLVDLPPFASSNLVNLFNAQLVVEELWLRAFIAEVVVVVAGCQPYPLAHSTHVCPFFSLMHSSLVSSHSHHDFGLLAPHAQDLGGFGLRKTFSLVPRVAKRSGTCNSRPPDCCAFSRREFPSRFSFLCTRISWVYPRRLSLRIGEWSG